MLNALMMIDINSWWLVVDFVLQELEQQVRCEVFGLVDRFYLGFWLSHESNSGLNEI